MTYEQSLIQGLTQMNANLRPDQAHEMPEGKNPKQKKVIQPQTRMHQPKEQTLGDISEHLMGMVHKPIPMDQAFKIQAA